MQWLSESQVLKNESLEDLYVKTKDVVVGKALEWSISVNKNIKENLGHIEAFDGAVDAIKASSKVADIVIISSANHDAILREWEAAGLLPYISFVASQDVGTKAHCLSELIKSGYDKSKVLMIGDARGDYYAAKSVGAHYHQITYQSEVKSWKEFDSQIRDSFINNDYMYDGDEVLEIALEDALYIIEGNADEYTDRFQHVSDKDLYPKEENKLWTMSFYPGQLYLAYEMTEDKAFIRNREAILKSFRERCDSGHMATHDIGFLFELTAYYDYLATKDEKSRQLVLDAADKLMLRYHENGGYIQAWGGPLDSKETSTRIIIDCMMNLPLLHIASKLTNDLKYKEAATAHARVSSTTLIRDDYSSYHTYWMNLEDGKPMHGATHQGHVDESTWARGQAWALYGFYKSYEWTKDSYFLDVATKCAKVFIENLPDNDICYWDFDFTDENPDIRDSSAASIAAAGLLKLGQVDTLEDSKFYEEAGTILLKRLANRYQNNEWTQGCGILKEGMYHRDQGFNEYTSWGGDYYYVEALSTFFLRIQSDMKKCR